MASAHHNNTISGYVLGDGELDSAHGAGNLAGLKRTPLVAIKYFCLNCCGGSLHPWRTADGKLEGPHLPHDEVRACPTTHCELWPFRGGRNPHSRRTGNPEGLRKARQVQLQAAPNAENRTSTAREATGSHHDTTGPSLRSQQATSTTQR